MDAHILSQFIFIMSLNSQPSSALTSWSTVTAVASARSPARLRTLWKQPSTARLTACLGASVLRARSWRVDAASRLTSVLVSIIGRSTHLEGQYGQNAIYGQC